MENRRGFIAWLFGLFGAGVAGNVSASPVPVSNGRKGFIAFYLNVGQLPPYKAEAFVDRMKDQLQRKHSGKSDDVVLDGWTLWIVPVRPPQETRFEFFTIDGTKINNVDAQKFFPAYNKVPFVMPDEKTVQDYVLLMLGAPVVQIELDQRQIDLAYNDTKALFKQVQSVKDLKGFNIDGCAQEQFKKMTLARAKIMLGHIRRKHQRFDFADLQQALSNEEADIRVQLDGDSLIQEGTEDLDNCLDYLRSV